MKKLEIKKDQLLHERDFIRFCNDDPANNYGGNGLNVTEEFLRAAEKDELIKPMLTEGKGKNKVNYYSPYQIYAAIELRKNKVNKEGQLYSPDSGRISVSGQPPIRFVAWGAHGGAFSANNIDYLKKKDEHENPWKTSLKLESFLKLLHGLDPTPRHLVKEEKRRAWTNAPVTDYDMQSLRDGGKKLLKLHGLDDKKINILRHNVGHFAEIIDPLAHWHYYINKHSGLRKDLLKGDAALAQHVYNLYYLITEVWEIITGKKSEPIFESIHKDFWLASYSPKTEHLTGDDTRAMKHAIEQFYKWSKEKGNKQFVSKEVLGKIKLVNEELQDFVKRYNERSYAGSSRIISEEDAVEIEELDPTTKRYVEMILPQREKQSDSRSSQTEIKQEIALAIMSRLGDIQRALRQSFWHISGQIRDKEHAVWEIINGDLWSKLLREGKFENLDRFQQRELAHKEHKKLENKANRWKGKAKKFHQNVAWYVDIVFCEICNENPVRIHDDSITTINSPWSGSRKAICDDCIKSEPEPRNLKGGEWNCQYCDRMIYKFAANNIINDLLKNTASSKVELEYGKMVILAKCPNSACKKENIRVVEWGWMP